MSSARLEDLGALLKVTWPDASESHYPWIFLRDNDESELHPNTRERLFDLTSVPIDVQPTSFTATDDGLAVHWPDRADAALYRWDWLQSHRPGQRRPDPAIVAREYWNADALPAIPGVSAAACTADPAALADALRTLKRTGMLLVEGLADELKSGEDIGRLIGFKRETNFGIDFEVEYKADPNNLAYTAEHLPLHSDLTNQELMPGYQFLHCYRNTVNGGASVFADGFRIAADLRDERPEWFRLLCDVPVPARFHDGNTDIRSRRKVIQLDGAGEISEFALNAHLADVPDLDADELLAFYPAYQDVMRRSRDARYALHHQLQPGQMVIFDNRRIMHGRSAFDAGGGQRHLHGFYVDYVEVDSRLRCLART